jgi:hypothetical protein
VSGYHMATENLTGLFYAQASIMDETLEATKDWFLRNASLGGIPEAMPTGNRAVQTWMTGETLCGLRRYLQATCAATPQTDGVDKELASVHAG